MLNKNKILIITVMGIIANLPSANAQTQTFYQCMPCPAGTYGSNGKCTPCPAGTYSQVSGATSSSVCTPCADGYFQKSEGSIACEPCTESIKVDCEYQDNSVIRSKEVSPRNDEICSDMYYSSQYIMPSKPFVRIGYSFYIVYISNKVYCDKVSGKSYVVGYVDREGKSREIYKSEMLYQE